MTEAHESRFDATLRQARPGRVAVVPVRLGPNGRWLRCGRMRPPALPCRFILGDYYAELETCRAAGRMVDRSASARASEGVPLIALPEWRQHERAAARPTVRAREFRQSRRPKSPGTPGVLAIASVSPHENAERRRLLIVLRRDPVLGIVCPNCGAINRVERASLRAQSRELRESPDWLSKLKMRLREAEMAQLRGVPRERAGLDSPVPPLL